MASKGKQRQGQCTLQTGTHATGANVRDLQQTIDVLRETIEGAQEMIAVEDTSSCYLAFNGAYHVEFKTVYGVDLKIGDKMFEVLAHLPDEQKSAIELFERTFRGEDFTITHAFGDEHLARRYYELHCFPVRDREGRVIAGTHIARDVTEQRRLMEALRTSEENYQRMIDSSMDCIKVLDLDGILLSINPSGQRLLEIENVFEYIGHHWLEGWQGEERIQAAEALERARAGCVGQFRAFSPTAKGTPKCWEVIIIPILDTAGRPERLQVVARDITEQKKAEDALRLSEERLRQAAEAAGVGAWQWDLTQDQLQGNARAMELLGLPPETMLSTPTFLERVYHEDRAHVQEGINRTIAAHGDHKDEFRTVWPDGSIHWLLVLGRAAYDKTGRPVQMYGVTLDITQRKQYEESLHEQSKHLLQADQRKDEFLAMLAHELRNPLAPIRNAVQIMHYVSANEQTLARQREIIERQVTHMARLLDDLLEISRITRGKITLKQERVDLAAVLARAVEAATPLVQSRHHTLTATMPRESLEVHGDFDRLIQIVGNLLNNAAKYTEEGGRIWLEASREGGQAVIRVRDTGMGIAPEMLTKVFDVFTQDLRAQDRAQNGLGLGLTLVRNLTQIHGGSVEAHSEGRGRGSEFVVRLPALPAKAQIAA